MSDNQSAIAISQNDVHHHRTKHIDIRHHYIREAVKTNQVKLQWIPTEVQLADMLTKGLAKNRFMQLRNKVQYIHVHE